MLSAALQKLYLCTQSQPCNAPTLLSRLIRNAAAPGSGKSSLLKALGNREIPIPEHVDTYFLDREAPASDQTALAAVMSVDEERARLEREAEALVTMDDPEVEQRLIDVYERWGRAPSPRNPAQ